TRSPTLSLHDALPICARMIADITWNAPAVYASPDPAGRFVTWWTREYFTPAAAQARAAYDAYHALLDTPDKLWFASEAVQNLIRSEEHTSELQSLAYL